MESGALSNSAIPSSIGAADFQDDDEKSQASWTSYGLDGSSFLFAENYQFFKNLYYPKSYANPANYFNSLRYRANIPALKKEQSARCFLVGDEDDVRSTIEEYVREATYDASEVSSSDGFEEVSSLGESEKSYTEDNVMSESSSESDSSDEGQEAEKSEKKGQGEVSKESKVSKGKRMNNTTSLEKYMKDEKKKERDEKLALECLSIWKRMKFAAKQPEANTYRAVYTSSGESVYEGSDVGETGDDLRVEDYVRCVAHDTSEEDKSSEGNETGISEEYSEEEMSSEENSEDDHKPPSIILEKWWIQESQPQTEPKVEQKEKEITVEMEPEKNEDRDRLKEAKKEELYKWREERHIIQKSYQKQIRANAEAMKRMMTMTPEELKQLVRAMNLFGDKGEEEDTDKKAEKEEIEKAVPDDKDMDEMGEQANVQQEEDGDENENLDEENEDEEEIDAGDLKEESKSEKKMSEVDEVAEEDVKEAKAQEEEAAEDIDSDVLSVHTSEIDVGDFGGKGAKRKHAAAAAAAGDGNVFTSKEDYDWFMLLKRGMYVVPKVYHRGWSIKAGMYGAEVTQDAKVIQLDYRFKVADLLNDDRGAEIPLYPEQLQKSFIPYEQETISWNPFHASQILFMDSWQESYKRICEQALDERWIEISPAHLIQPTVEQCTALEILELKALRSEACLDGDTIERMVEHYLNFCRKMKSFDFFDEDNLEKFKTVGGCDLLKAFLQIDIHEIQMASLELLERFTKTEKYAEFFLDTCPEIMTYLQDKCVRVWGTVEQIDRSVIALVVLKNMSRCDGVKAHFETGRYLGRVCVTFDECLTMLGKKRPTDPDINVAFYCAGVMVQIMSNASERDPCKFKISLHQVTKQLKPFLENPMFQNDAIFLCKNLSTLEHEKLILLEQKVLTYVQDILQHYVRFKDFYPCTELVRNLLQSPHCVNFVPSDQMVAILTGLVIQSNRLEFYKSNEDMCTTFLELLQIFLQKYSDESCVHFLQELRVGQHVMRNLHGLVRHYLRHHDCDHQIMNEGKTRIELRVDILDRLVEYPELRKQFTSLKPLVKLLPMGHIELYPKTFRKVLRIMKSVSL